MADVFLSYARPDATLAGRVARELGKSGLSVWFDRDLPPPSCIFGCDCHRARGGAGRRRDLVESLSRVRVGAIGSKPGARAAQTRPSPRGRYSVAHAVRPDSVRRHQGLARRDPAPWMGPGSSQHRRPGDRRLVRSPKLDEADWSKPPRDSGRPRSCRGRSSGSRGLEILAEAADFAASSALSPKRDGRAADQRRLRTQ